MKYGLSEETYDKIKKVISNNTNYHFLLFGSRARGNYKKTSDIDIAIVGIGSREIIQIFGKAFGYSEGCVNAIGDISTHFFDEDGKFVELYENTLCAEKENLKNAKQTIAIACGKQKTEAIIGALRTQMIDTLITDEYTAKDILAVFEKRKK